MPEVVPFNVKHLNLLEWRDSEAAHAEEIMHTAAAHFDEMNAISCMHAGRPVVIAGVIPYGENKWLCYAIFSKHADRHATIIARWAKKEFAVFCERLGSGVLIAYNRPNEVVNDRMLVWLGFKRIGFNNNFGAVEFRMEL